MKFGEKNSAKDSLKFFDSYPKEKKMALFLKDTEIRGQSRVLWILAPDWSAIGLNSQSGAKIQRSQL